MFEVGDLVEVVDGGRHPDSSYCSYLDGKHSMLGKTFRVMAISKEDRKLSVKTDHCGGWWVNPKALRLVDPSSAVLRKIAFMDKRFKERNNV